MSLISEEAWDEGKASLIEQVAVDEARKAGWSSTLPVRLGVLLGRWEAELDTFPIETDQRAAYAHKTLELCIQELSDVLRREGLL